MNDEKTPLWVQAYRAMTRPGIITTFAMVYLALVILGKADVKEFSTFTLALILWWVKERADNHTEERIRRQVEAERKNGTNA